MHAYAESADSQLALSAVARYLLETNDDILHDRFVEIAYDDATPDELRALFQYVYLHGSCAIFAAALHQKFGLPIMRFLAHDFSVHFACHIGGDVFLDAEGLVKESAIRKRYKFAASVKPKRVSLEECLADALGINDPDDSYELKAAHVVIEYLDITSDLQPSSSNE